MQAQGVPVHERVSACPQPLSLPTPGPCKAYHRDCTEYRPIPGGGPVDNPASHRGEVVYAGDHQVNHDHDERVPPGEECALPGACQRPLGAPTNLSRALVWVPIVQGPPYRIVHHGQLAELLVPVRIVPHFQE